MTDHIKGKTMGESSAALDRLDRVLQITFVIVVVALGCIVLMAIHAGI